MKTDNVSTQRRRSILNTLAIAGFVAIILLLTWLSVQLVQVTPNALTALASLAEGVDQASETIVAGEVMEPIAVTSNTSLVNTGESLDINWDRSNERGSYVFAYDCINGVSIVEQNDGIERQLECNTNYNVGDIDQLTLTIESEENRYTDVTYSVAFLATTESEPRAIGNNVITIINSDVKAFAFTDDAEALVNEEIVSEPVVAVETPVVTTAVSPVPKKPVFEQEFVYTIPTSDPNGTTDLATAFIAMGEVINEQFVPGPVASQNGGAIQFSVKNLGTKTSKEWTFSITLPNGGMYNSPAQVELKPNERAVLTIGFPAGSATAHTFAIAVVTNNDRDSGNDSFAERVMFAR